MRFLEPPPPVDRVQAFAIRSGRRWGFSREDRDDLVQELLLRLHVRDALGNLFPKALVQRILRQGLSNHLRSRARKKRKPTGFLVPLSAVGEFANRHAAASGDPTTRDFDLDWSVILATFDPCELLLVDQWRDHDWRRPPKLSNDERKQFHALRRKLAERLIELGYRWGGNDE